MYIYKIGHRWVRWNVNFGLSLNEGCKRCVVGARAPPPPIIHCINITYGVVHYLQPASPAPRPNTLQNCFFSRYTIHLCTAATRKMKQFTFITQPFSYHRIPCLFSLITSCFPFILLNISTSNNH